MYASRSCAPAERLRSPTSPRSACTSARTRIRPSAARCSGIYRDARFSNDKSPYSRGIRLFHERWPTGAFPRAVVLPAPAAGECFCRCRPVVSGARHAAPARQFILDNWKLEESRASMRPSVGASSSREARKLQGCRADFPPRFRVHRRTRKHRNFVLGVARRCRHRVAPAVTVAATSRHWGRSWITCAPHWTWSSEPEAPPMKKPS